MYYVFFYHFVVKPLICLLVKHVMKSNGVKVAVNDSSKYKLFISHSNYNVA